MSQLVLAIKSDRRNILKLFIKFLSLKTKPTVKASTNVSNLMLLVSEKRTENYVHINVNKKKPITDGNKRKEPGLLKDGPLVYNIRCLRQ